jgi:sulfane dehydrogenase subunit SoxC
MGPPDGSRRPAQLRSGQRSEWNGVPLATLLAEVGVQPTVGDCGRRGRLPDGAQHPLSKALETALAYGQNGEMIRPSQGYPLRLINPGWKAQ